MLNVVRRIQIEEPIEQQVKRICGPRLAFTQDGIPESRQIVPEGILARP